MSKPLHSSKIVRSTVSLLSGMSFLSGGLLIAQTETTPIPPETQTTPTVQQPVLSAPQVIVPDTPPSQSKISELLPKPKPQKEFQPEVVIQSNTPTTPVITLENPDPTLLRNPSRIKENKPATIQPVIVLTQRNNPCKTITDNGHLRGGECGTNSVIKDKPPTTFSQEKRLNSPPTQSRFTKAISKPEYQYSQNTGYIPLNPSQQVDGYTTVTPPQGYQIVSINPISTVSSFVPQYRSGRTSLIFPLSLPEQISSTFGWRVHPISGTMRMHEGTDIAAPLGTPVLAAYSGRVAFAGENGGYGLMVALRHENETQESRYGHLSEILVQPNQWVEQGTVIGLVGSTGYSTGPHLHFEWRYSTNQGWIPVDAGLHLEYAMEDLIQSMELAKQNPQNPNGDSQNLSNSNLQNPQVTLNNP